MSQLENHEAVRSMTSFLNYSYRTVHHANNFFNISKAKHGKMIAYKFSLAKPVFLSKIHSCTLIIICKLVDILVDSQNCYLTKRSA